MFLLLMMVGPMTFVILRHYLSGPKKGGKEGAPQLQDEPQKKEPEERKDQFHRLVEEPEIEERKIDVVIINFSFKERNRFLHLNRKIKVQKGKSQK